LPAPEQSLRVQDGDQLFGNEIDGGGISTRPSAIASYGPLPGISPVAAQGRGDWRPLFRCREASSSANAQYLNAVAAVDDPTE
jgi:hypothetical protein